MAVSDAVLDGMERDGWTPSQVRALVTAYREVMRARQAVLDLAAGWKASDSKRAQLYGRELEAVATKGASAP